MIKWLFKGLRHLWRNKAYAFRYRRLNSMRDMEQFLSFVIKVEPKDFLRYQKVSLDSRLEFQSVVNTLHLKLKGITFLDVGPGYGESLNICHENGAKCVDFVEIDPFFFNYNRLKGFTKGYQFNIIRGFRQLEQRKYDFIWMKGSISAGVFMQINRTLIPRIIFPSLSSWLTQLERLASPACQIIICPYWAGSTRRNIDDVRHTSFSETMLDRGFVILPKIKEHNHEPWYPITFYKCCSAVN